MFVNSTSLFRTIFQHSPVTTVTALIGSALTIYAIYRKWKHPLSEQIITTQNHTLKITADALLLRIEVIGDPKNLDDFLRRPIAKAIQSWCQLQDMQLSHDLPESSDFDTKEKNTHTNEQSLADEGKLTCAYSFNSKSYTFWINGTDEALMRVFKQHAVDLIKKCRRDLGITKAFFHLT